MLWWPQAHLCTTGPLCQAWVWNSAISVICSTSSRPDLRARDIYQGETDATEPSCAVLTEAARCFPLPCQGELMKVLFCFFFLRPQTGTAELMHATYVLHQ